MKSKEVYSFIGANSRKQGTSGFYFEEWLKANPRSSRVEIANGGHNLRHLQWDLRVNPDSILVEIVEDEGEVSQKPKKARVKKENPAALVESEPEIAEAISEEAPAEEATAEEEAAVEHKSDLTKKEIEVLMAFPVSAASVDELIEDLPQTTTTSDTINDLIGGNIKSVKSVLVSLEKKGVVFRSEVEDVSYFILTEEGSDEYFANKK